MDPSAQLDQAVAAARTTWPNVRVTTEDFAAYLARQQATDPATRAIGDLYLACGCVHGDPIALAEFELHCLADVGSAVRQIAGVDSDDVLQRVREKLFVGAPGGAPLITRYAGRGSLRGWVRSIAVRTAIKQLHRDDRMIPVDDHVFFEFAAANDDPELEHCKQRYRAQLRAAFKRAVELLSVRQRNILRQYYLDGLTIDDLAALYRVHRATAARWVADLRGDLLAHVRRSIETELALGSEELQSMVRLVGSQLELSLERLLGSAA